MVKKAKTLHTKKGVELKIVNPNAAGIDIADTEMQVCIPVDRDGNNNRRFGSFTRDLNEICERLVDCGIDTAAMETKGIYWIPLFFKLKESGIDVILVNAHEVKNISEKKTDEADAEWLMLLHIPMVFSKPAINRKTRPVRCVILPGIVATSSSRQARRFSICRRQWNR